MWQYGVMNHQNRGDKRKAGTGGGFKPNAQTWGGIEKQTRGAGETLKNIKFV